MDLTRSEAVMLTAIAKQSGRINWYQLGRIVIGEIDSPEHFSLQRIREAGLIETIAVEGESLPRLEITDAGTHALAEYDQRRT